MHLHMRIRIDGLLLNPEHPRADLEHDLKAWLQTMHTECISQLAISGHGKESLLLQEGSVIPALEAVAQSGLTQHGRELARTALLALSDTDGFKVAPSTDGIRHIMISCEPSPHRIGSVRRGYVLTYPHTFSHYWLIHSFVCLFCFCTMDGVHVNVDQWDVQATIQRLNDSLIARGYVTWFDLKDMKVSLTKWRLAVSFALELIADDT
eukprot:COSAG06_NODE_163_length_21566_cov_9.641070_10_plen_208_part_00